MNCSVCNKNKFTRELATAKGNVNICDDCYAKLVAMKSEVTEPKSKMKKLPVPTQIRALLDEYVIGQDSAKKVLSVAVYNHYKRTFYGETQNEGERVELSKSNVLMLGPTGSGKTLIARTLARAIDVPFATSDATALVSGGGRGLEDKIITSLLQSCDYDVARAERGIIYIDEIDKIAKKGHNSALGESIQQSLLKIIEGTVAELSGPGGKKIKIDTHNILFIAGGAFVDIDTIILMRFGGGVAIGETRSFNDLLKEVTPEDIAKYGLIPEFIGRLPVIVTLDELDKATLITILTTPKNAVIKQYKTKFALDGIELDFDDSALDEIAEAALKLKTGARGLRTIIENSMLDIMYNAPSEKNLNKVTVSADVIAKTGGATFQYIEATEEVLMEEQIPKPSRTKTAN